MNAKEPLLTIAIPTYKRPKYIMQALKSAVMQNTANLRYEVIVVNNDPDSDMSYLIDFCKDKKVSVRFYKNKENIGMLGNVNKCVKLAKGKYVAFLHDDDLLLPSYINEVKDILLDKDICCLIPTRYLLFEGRKDTNYSLEKKKKKKDIISALFFPKYLHRHKLTQITPLDNVNAWQNCYGAPSCGVIFRKDALLKYDLFYPEGTYAWDFISFLKLNEKEKIYILHRPVSVYRMTTGLSLRPEVQCDFYEAFCELLRRYESSSKFIKRFHKEIQFLNYHTLSEEGKKLLADEGKEFIKKYPSRIKYIQFMFLRVCYYSYHNLDVEVTITKRAKRLFKMMNIIEQ